MSDVEDVLVETIAAGLFQHRRDGDRCACGWSDSPMLDSVHRAHQAESLLGVTLMAVAQMRGDYIADKRARTHAVGLLLLDSGDITPMGTRLLDKIWEDTGEPAGQNV